MAEPESKPKYAVNPETGQVMRNDGTGWQKVKTAKNEAGDILINEGGQWAPLPGRSSAPAPAGFAQPPKMSIADAAMVAGRQGREWGASDEAAGVRKAMGVPDWAARAYEIANPMAPFVNMGMGIGGMVGEATGNAPSGYTQGRDEARAELAQARSDRPVTSFVSELAGGAAYPAGALKMGAPILGQTVKMGAIGGAQGAAYGYAASEGDTEDRLTTGAIGGVLGAGLGGAMPSLAAAIVPYFRAGKGGVSQFSDWLAGKVGLPVGAVDKHNEEVVRAAILRSAERSKMTPEKILSEIERLGDKPAVLAEVIGQDAVNALSAITRRPGSSPQKAQAIIEDRFGGFVDRAQTDLEQATGFQRGAFAQGVDSPAVAEEIAARQAAAKPVYAEAFGQFPTIVSERLTQMAQGSPLLQSAMAKAQKALANEATSVGRAVDEMPELQFWDLVKRQLDADETAAKAKPGGQEAVRQIEIIRKPLVDELDAITGGIYARARELGGEAPRLRSAFTSGQRALGAKPAGAIEAEVGAMNPQDQPWFRAGMTGDISTRIDQGRLPPTRFRVPDVQKKVRAGFGEEAGNAFIRNMEAEASLRETGARWAPRMQSITGTVLESGPEEFAADGLSALGRLMSGDKLGFLRDISGFMRRRGYNQAQIDAMGDLLLSNPQEGLKRLGIQLPQGGPPSGGGAAGGAVGAGFGPSSQMPENAFAQTMSNQQTVPSQNAFTRSQGFGGFEGVKQVSDLVRLYKNMSGEQMRESLLDRNGPEFLRTSLMKMTLNELQALYKNITGEVPPQGGMNDTRSAIMDALQSNRPLSTEAPAPSTKTASASSPKPDYRDENQIKIDNLVSIVKAMSPEDLVRAYGQKPTPGTSEAKGELIDFALMKMTQSELLGMYARLGGPKPDDVTMTGLRAAIVGQLRGNSANSIGLGNAFAQSVMGGAGGSAYGSRNDINGDGVIDEQDVFLGSAAGTVGVPLAMGVAGRVGNAFAPGARSMGMGNFGGGKYRYGPTGKAFDAFDSRNYDQIAQDSGGMLSRADVEELMPWYAEAMGDGLTPQEIARLGDTNDPRWISLSQVMEMKLSPMQGRQDAQTMGLGGGGRKPPPDSPEAITEAVRGIARETPRSSQNAFVPPRGNMRGVLQAPERVPPASPMADQVPPPLPPRPVSNRVPTSNMPNATEIGLMAGTGAAIGGAFLMEKANDPATFGLASFDQLPPDHPLRDPNYRRMALMAQMQPQQSQNAFASARQ